MHSDELASRRNYRVPSHGRPHSRRPQRRKRGWLLALLSALVVLLIIAYLSNEPQGVIPFGNTAVSITIPQNSAGEADEKLLTIQIGGTTQTSPCYLMPGERLTFKYEQVSPSFPYNLLGYAPGQQLLGIDGCNASPLNPTSQLHNSLNGGVSPQDQNVQTKVICLDWSNTTRADQVTLVSNQQQGLLPMGKDYRDCS